MSTNQQTSAQPSEVSQAPVLDIPRIESQGLVLRQHELQDADGVLERNRDELTKRFTNVPPTYSRERAERFISEVAGPTSTSVLWAIEDDGEYAGSIEIGTFGRGFGYGAASIGYGLAPHARGHGVMTRAVDIAADEAFSRGTQTIVWQAEAGNVGSWKTAWRNGFHNFTYAPALIAGKAGIEDGWHAVLQADDERTPQTESWKNDILNSGTPDALNLVS